jgi:hypothetical protein
MVDSGGKVMAPLAGDWECDCAPNEVGGGRKTPPRGDAGRISTSECGAGLVTNGRVVVGAVCISG